MAEDGSTTVDESLRPQLDRFQAALGARATQPVEPNGAEGKLFAAAFTATVNNYVDPVDPAKLIDAAIAGMDNPSDPTKRSSVELLVGAAITAMLLALDQDSAYLNPELYQELQVDTREQFGGAGLEITKRNGVLTIVSPIEGGPAARVGLLPGDQLLAIDGVSADGVDLVQAVRRLRGPVGSELVLTVRRAGSAEVLTQPITREVVLLRSVTFSRIGEAYGYIRISQFQERTVSDLRKALDSLHRDGPLDGLVLDLRNNPGGLLSQAVRVADVFLNAGIVVRTESRAHGHNQTYPAGPEGAWGDIPMVVLVNRGSAAGGEIVAAALQAHKRALVIGTRTYGRGTIQTIIPIGDQGALRLTTARAYSPTGSAIELGVQPDVVVDAEPAAGVPSAHDSVVAAALRLLSGSGAE